MNYKAGEQASPQRTQRFPKQHQLWPIRNDGGCSMKSQVRAGAMLLTGILSGSTYAVTLALPQQQQQAQQDSSNQQQNQQSKDKKKKGDQPAANSNGPAAQQNQSTTTSTV